MRFDTGPEQASVRQHYMQNLWRWSCGLPEIPINSRVEIRAEQWSREFEGLMRARLIMGAYRYGVIRDPGKARYDRVGSVIRRLVQYRQTGNAEHLVDSANLLMLEFVEPTHPGFHFCSVDDGEHTDQVQ